MILGSYTIGLQVHFNACTLRFHLLSLCHQCPAEGVATSWSVDSFAGSALQLLSCVNIRHTHACAALVWETDVLRRSGRKEGIDLPCKTEGERQREKQ